VWGPPIGDAGQYRFVVTRSERVALPKLRAALRWVSAGASLVMLALTVSYVIAPRTTTIVAPQCVGGDECAVVVASPIDAPIVIAGLAVVALFALMAVTGLPFSIMLGNGVGIVPAVDPEAKVVDRIPDSARPVDLAPPVEEGQPDPKPEVLALELWNSIPEVLQEELEVWASDTLGLSLTEVQLGIESVRRQRGQGNHPYYVTLLNPRGGETYVVKLSLGGRGKRGPSLSAE
jgi:hypothetical protein